MTKIKIVLTVIGSIISAIAASICCLGQAVLAILGVSGVGLFSNFGSLRPYFIGATVILLGAAFYLTYRKKEVKCEDGTCKIKGTVKWNKIALWISTGLVAVLITFPYIKLSSQNLHPNQAGGEIEEVIISVEGMTCAGCKFHVENAIRKLGGIIEVNADYKKGQVYVKFWSGKITINNIAEAINKIGYKATPGIKEMKN